ncbi:MAG TPA: trypsin-like peptidase domain-containing protein [Candidatus Tripitaka sp. YC43]
MKRYTTFLFALCLLASTLHSPAPLSASDGFTPLPTPNSPRDGLKKDLKELEQKIKPLVETFRKVVQLVGPSVVSISMTRKGIRDIEYRGPGLEQPGAERRSDPHHGTDFPRWGQGSGVIIDKRGYVLTNLHVIEGYEEGAITVTTANGKVYDGKVVGLDSKTDLVVLKAVSAPGAEIGGNSFEPVEFGDSEKVMVGDWVITIGSPFGYQQTVSAGIVSAVGRKGVVPCPKHFEYEDFIQTDAASNPGNSGGPLINLSGEVIGINTAIATRNGGFQGVGFAISASVAKEVGRHLIEKGRVIRGYLGVDLLDINDESARRLGFPNEKEMLVEYGLPSGEGAFVSDVWEDTPASKGGIRPGDVVLAVGTKRIADSDGLQKYVSRLQVEGMAEVTILRDKSPLTLTIKIEEQPENMEGRKSVSVVRRGAPEQVGLGLTLQELTPEIAQPLGYQGEKGLIVADVEVGSPADRVGIRPGDLILQLGHKPVKTLLEFRQVLVEAQRRGEKVTLLLKGRGFVTVKP